MQETTQTMPSSEGMVEITAPQYRILPPAVPQPVTETMAVVQLMERLALSPDVDPAKLEKMLDMQERIMDRNARKEFDVALAQMQAELPSVEKTKAGDGGKWKFASFEDILSVIKPYLTQYGFAITHRIKTTPDGVCVTGILSHKGGHREETEFTLPDDKSGSKNGVQARGSTAEYGRRYTMNSLLGIATKNADNDGGKNKEPEGNKLINKTQAANIRRLIKSVNISEGDFCKTARIERIEDLEARRYVGAIQRYTPKPQQGTQQ